MTERTEQAPADAPTHTTVVIGGGVWGKGSTLDEAKRNFSRYGGSLSAGYVILTFGSRSEFAGVDEIGRVHWSGDDPAERHVKARGHR